MSKLPDNMLKLLQSPVIEDVIIGIELCYSKLGSAWCIRNFTDRNADLFSTLNIPMKDKLYLLVYDDIEILIGSRYIQTTYSGYGAGDNYYIRINNKTK